jgi:transketolase
MFAGFHQLSNLAVLIDNNGYQAMGKTSDVLAIPGLGSALSALGFEVQIVDGHSEELIDSAIISHRKSGSLQPLAVIANTVKGKGVSFIENKNYWHYTRLDENTFAQALKELESIK